MKRKLLRLNSFMKMRTHDKNIDATNVMNSSSQMFMLKFKAHFLGKHNKYSNFNNTYEETYWGKTL